MSGDADWGAIALVTFTTAIGILALADCFQGWLFKRSPVYERMMLLVAGIALVYPGAVSHSIGLSLIVLVLLSQWLRSWTPAAART